MFYKKKKSSQFKSEHSFSGWFPWKIVNHLVTVDTFSVSHHVSIFCQQTKVLFVLFFFVSLTNHNTNFTTDHHTITLKTHLIKVPQQLMFILNGL